MAGPWQDALSRFAGEALTLLGSDPGAVDRGARDGAVTLGSRASLERLREAYPNLTYIACHQTADRLREKGVRVKLLPGVHFAPTALDEIVKRMQQGWVYIRA